MRARDITSIIADHKKYWDGQRSLWREISDLYSTRMWKDKQRNQLVADQVLVETPDGFGYVESYVGSLHVKAPAIDVSLGSDEQGDPAMVRTIANDWLYHQVENVNQLLRLGFIFPFSIAKLSVLPNRRDIEDAIKMDIVKPWDVLVDMTATTWEEQRYVGHRYYMPITRARKRWTGRKWSPSYLADYLDPNAEDNSDGAVEDDGSEDSYLSFVEIYEIYDLENDKLIFYSPSVEKDDHILATTTPIPIRTHDDQPCPPLVPFYSSEDCDVPLRGASPLARVKDQLTEINFMRTYWANGVRRDNRLYFVRKGALSNDAKQTINEGRDMSFIEVELNQNEALSGIVHPIQNFPISMDFERYKVEIRADLDRGSMMAPFTRGEATHTTATEVNYLQIYAAGEIGRLARRRDLAIEDIAYVYIRMIYALLDDPESKYDRKTITVDGVANVLTAEKLNGAMKIASADQSATPMGSALRRQTLQGLVPLLAQLGTPAEALLAQIVKEYDLPPGFIPSSAVKPSTGAPPTTEATPGQSQPSSEVSTQALQSTGVI